MRFVKHIGVGHHPFSKKFEFKGYFDEPTPALIATDYKAPKTILELWGVEDINEKESDNLTKSSERYNADEQADITRTEAEEWATEFAIRAKEGNLDPIPKYFDKKFEQYDFSYVSIFSGIGGFEQALNKFGGTCVLSSEIDKFANQAYEVLYGEPTAGDITQIDARDVPEHDLLVGGFPCQSYSVAGKRKGLDDARGTLFFEIVRIADEKKPKVLLLENVKGLVGHMSEADFDGATRFHLEKGEILWEIEENSRNIKSNIVKRNVENYLRMRSLEILDCQQSRFTTLLESTQISDTEKAETFLKYGLTKRLKFLKTQILQTTKRLSDFQIEQIQQYVCNVDVLGSNLKKLNLEESSLVEVINSLGLTEDMKKGVGLLWRNISEEKSLLRKSFTTSTETSPTIELTTFIFALTELLTIEYIIKHSSLSVSLLIKALSDLTKKKKNTFTIPTLDILISTINDIGYTVDFEVLNSKYFGVPQNRERIFIIAVRDDLVETEPWNIEGNTVVPKGKRRISAYEGIKTFNFEWPSQDSVTTRLRDILETEVDEKYYLDDEKTAKLVAQLNEGAGLGRDGELGTLVNEVNISPTIDASYAKGLGPSDVAKNRNRRPMYTEEQGLTFREATNKKYTLKAKKPGERMSRQAVETFNESEQPKEHGDIIQAYNRQHLKDGICPTLTTRPEGFKTASLPIVESEPPKYRIRKLTPKECLRLQAFPDEAHDALEAAGISNSQRYKMAGNAVTVSVIEAIGERLVRFL